MDFNKSDDVPFRSRADRADASDPATTLAAEGLELMHAFVQIHSAEDRRKLVDFAKRLLRSAQN
jgi:hypothetical protein